jgi:hypothetical protein
VASQQRIDQAAGRLGNATPGNAVPANEPTPS